MKVSKVRPHQLKAFVLDLDGVFTDGSFYYTDEGKVMKKFGADDTDALLLLSNNIRVQIVTADHRGFGIGHTRFVKHLGLDLELVPSSERLKWIRQRYQPHEIAYMGDSFTDAGILRAVGLGIAPANSSQIAIDAADHVTSKSGGYGAVAEACFWISNLYSLDLGREYKV